MSSLQHIIATLRQNQRDLATAYYVPGLWVDYETTEALPVNPYQFYADKLAGILDAPQVPLFGGNGGGAWTRQAIIYNLFPRVSTAYDHAHDDGDHLSVALLPGGWRETGTLLKSIALLPYIQNLGINTVYLLPITAVGQDGKKGTLGSPYGIRNPYKLDENLNEPALDLDVDTLFAGFVEAAHHLGMRVVMEFVLRTSSKDGDWIGEHPEWFYWIREDVPDRAQDSRNPSAYGSPVFQPGDLGMLKDMVERDDFSALIPPPEAYQAMFTLPPRPDQIHMENGRWAGVLDDGTRVRIPGAFSDWPPDDNQPPWTDVTYLRLYDHPDFNYMAYNTLRMYDERLAQPENEVRDLWDAIVGVIPHYQRTFGIDGVMIDMGHALPMPLKRRVVETARAINPEFAFWDENFMITQQSVDEGYNAVVGYLVFDLHMPNKLRAFCQWMADEELPLPFFATPENHNTPRAASRPFALEYVHYVLIMSVLIPALPFVHSGFELLEMKPINTGLGFTSEMIAAHPSYSLPLFSEWAFDWTRSGNLVGSIQYALKLRRKYARLLSNPDPKTFVMGYSDNEHFIVFARIDEENTLIAIANSSMGTHERGRAYLPMCNCDFEPVWGTDVKQQGRGTISIEADLGPGQVLVFEAGPDFPRFDK